MFRPEVLPARGFAFASAALLLASLATRTPHESPTPEPPEVRLVIPMAGVTHLQLGDASAIRRGAAALVAGDGEAAVIERVASEDVPPALRALLGTAFTTGACTGVVAGFAVVTRLAGDRSYAEDPGDGWDVASVRRHGQATLAARLDRPCRGEVAWRLGRAAPVIGVEVALAPELDRAARASFPDREDLIVRAVQHPTTGATVVTVQARSGGCGDPSVNQWAMFRVVAGALVAERVTSFDDEFGVDGLIDLDGDGTFELLGYNVLARATGEVIERVETPFYGCPC